MVSGGNKKFTDIILYICIIFVSRVTVCLQEQRSSGSAWVDKTHHGDVKSAGDVRLARLADPSVDASTGSTQCTTHGQAAGICLLLRQHVDDRFLSTIPLDALRSRRTAHDQQRWGMAQFAESHLRRFASVSHNFPQLASQLPVWGSMQRRPTSCWSCSQATRTKIRAAGRGYYDGKGGTKSASGSLLPQHPHWSNDVGEHLGWTDELLGTRCLSVWNWYYYW